jgi:prepilin-type N-terminal cleavage/methylation domain-containing protein
MRRYADIIPGDATPRPFRKPYRSFTLLEVIVAIAILSLVIAAAMEMSAAAARRSGKALASWKRRHMLQQAVEYYLIEGPEADIPDEFFPYDGYHSECLVETPERLPEWALPEKGSWRIVRLTVSIKTDDDKTVDSISFWKILPATP